MDAVVWVNLSRVIMAIPTTNLGIATGTALMTFRRGDDKNREADGGGILHETLRATGKRT